MTRSHRLPVVGLVVAFLLAAAAMLVPAVSGWNVHVNSFPPLHAEWLPRLGPGTAPALLLAALASWRAVDLAQRASWRALLAWSFVAALAWMVALAYVDGPHGMGAILDSHYEYMNTARRYPDFAAVLPDWVSRITYARTPHNWTVHVAGHPPGATLFFWLLVRLGFDTGIGAGWVLVVLVATTPAAVLCTLRVLDAEDAARRAAPFLVFGPAAVWSAVSADALFGTCAAWGVAALAVAATRTSWAARAGWSVVAGLLLGALVMLSYGLPVMGVLCLAVLWLARSWWPLPITAVVALGVVGVFALLGFDYLQALKAIHIRYYEGVASRRPPSYWMWANLGALVFSAGPLLGAGLGLLLARARTLVRDPATRVVATLALAGVAMVVLVDLSQMSRAEVERIWLPFEPWLLLSVALLPESWRRRGLVLQLVVALLVQHLLQTGW
ncbi:hypothetical protein D9V37_10910 [Nocardioides mangrovicus]|uniref:Glycosyltransferase RgtA/B/C/D-like domain-containing protein n=1 Tax=Nocardioides mangrovicus TaxID=2478913 RepID=A0A3L8P0V5_9ACTN|nr:hypothetical protein [Nocardioides mangrovicus]RLV49076.1 hypothetical protein D9V37_10910 [Nocardioides mangrovicus]